MNVLQLCISQKQVWTQAAGRRTTIRPPSSATSLSLSPRRENNNQEHLHWSLRSRLQPRCPHEGLERDLVFSRRLIAIWERP